MPLQRPFRALSHVHPPSSTPAPPTLLYISQPCHPLSTPLAPTILLSPHRPALNRLLWNLFKYFDISPPLTSRAEMICDSWRWARSEQLPQTPCFLFFLPSFFGEGQIFPFQPPSPFYLSYLLLLLLSAEAGLERFLACFFSAISKCDRQTGWYSYICWHCVFAVFHVPFAQFPPTVWLQADTMYLQHWG